MNRFNTTLALAALSFAGFGAGALAQDRSAMVPTLDATHATSHSSKIASKAKTHHRSQVGKIEVRDWKAIDKNHDNLIEPDEMEAYLKQKG